MNSIKTPDQRVRVFISSTIGELADERKAATDAITKLRLTPVLFELGARPHPPRELYRAYLEQSHIFVGIYWNSYGWIAPDMEISGLEDEYRLAGEKTKLIYIKQPAEQRDEKLTALLNQIQHHGTACYRKFSTAAELKELMENDLALLLSERFEHVTQQAQQVEVKNNCLPVIHSKLFGREKELKELKEVLSKYEVSLLTLTGTGGTGKTRLAIQLAHNVVEQFNDGVYYVPLASVTDEKLVAATIAHVIGLFDSGKQSIKDTLLDYLHDKKLLLVLDNFEQIIKAAVLVSEILERCAHIKVVVTSRSPLHIRGEHIIPVLPLQHPQGELPFSRDEILQFASVELFVQRAKAVNPHLQLDENNTRAIAEICKRLDGLPLAIELAASRTKFFSPVALQKRMSSTLDLLSHGQRDLPDRQKTLRATIDWSYNLLDEDGKKLFRQLAVFSDGWTLDSAQAVADADSTFDILEAMERLLDFGLVRTFSFYNEQDSTVEPRFSMLQTVLEYAGEKLAENNETADAKKAHARYFISMAEEINPDLWLVSDSPVFNRIDRDYQNLRAAFWNSIESRNYRDAWRLVRALNHCWMAQGRLGEAMQWIEAAGIAHNSDKPGKVETVEDKRIFAGTLLSSGIIMFSVGNFTKAKNDLTRSIELYRELNFQSSVARAMIYLGITGMSNGDYNALSILKEARELAKSIDDPYGIIGSSATLAEASAIAGNFEAAKQLIREGEHLARQLGNKMLLGVALMQKGNLLCALGDYNGSATAFHESLDAYRHSGFKIFSSWSILGLAHCSREQHDYEQSQQYYSSAISEGRKTGERVIVSLGLLGIAGIDMHYGRFERAARLLGRIDATVKELGYSFWLADRKLHNDVTSELHSKLPETQFAAAYEYGSKITLEDAITLVENKAERMKETI